MLSLIMLQFLFCIRIGFLLFKVAGIRFLPLHFLQIHLLNVGNNPVPEDPSSESSEPNVVFSPFQAKLLYWVNGLVNIPKALTPITTWWGERNNHNYLKNPAAKALKVYSDVITDIGRQTTTCTFQLVSYFVGGNIIQALLSKLYPAREDDPKSLAKQQLIIQISSLLIQVTATILSRRFGAAQLSRVFAQKEMPGTEVVETKLQGFVNHWINKILRDPVTDILKPGKAAVVGTGGIALYLGTLVGVLYGVSTLLETLFPSLYKPQKSKAPKKESGTQKPQPALNVYSGGAAPFPVANPWLPTGSLPQFPVSLSARSAVFPGLTLNTAFYRPNNPMPSPFPAR